MDGQVYGARNFGRDSSAARGGEIPPEFAAPSARTSTAPAGSEAKAAPQGADFATGRGRQRRTSTRLPASAGIGKSLKAATSAPPRILSRVPNLPVIHIRRIPSAQAEGCVRGCWQ